MSEMWLPEVEDREKWAIFMHLGEKNCFNLQATTIIKGFIQTYTHVCHNLSAGFLQKTISCGEICVFNDHVGKTWIPNGED